MRIRIFTTPEIRLLLKETRELGDIPTNSSVIQRAISVAHTACMKTPAERSVFRNEELHQQHDFYLGPGVIMPTTPRDSPSGSAKLDSVGQMQLAELLAKGFQESCEKIVSSAVYVCTEKFLSGSATAVKQDIWTTTLFRTESKDHARRIAQVVLRVIHVAERAGSFDHKVFHLNRLHCDVIVHSEIHASTDCRRKAILAAAHYRVRQVGVIGIGKTELHLPGSAHRA